MSFNEIGAAFTLATLSKPVCSTNGRIHAASVCSLSGIKKRKRTEIAVGLNGEGISIYSLQNPQLVTSYALPPSTAFTLAPFSVYRKGSSKTSSQRFTYASVTGSAQSDKSQLICFQEKSSGDRTETAKTAYAPSSGAQILALDALPVTPGGSATAATHDILATFDNGDVICLSADLETVRWVAKLEAAKVGGTIAHVSTSTAKAVIRGLLRNREDVASLLAPTNGNASDLLELTQILCVVSRKPSGSVTLSLLQVQSRSPDLTTAPMSPLKLLVSWDLKQRTNASTSTTHYALHSSSGILHMLEGSTLLSYDFSENVPKLYSELTLPGSDIDSFLRLSQDTLLMTSRQTCRVFDARFNTLQAVHSLDTFSTLSDAASPAKKRKIAQAETTEQNSQVNLLAYYADHDLVVAVREGEVIGMQIDGSFTHKRPRQEGTLLSEALGKGISCTSAREAQKWSERKAKLDRYASKGRINKFEKAIAGDLGIETESNILIFKEENEVNGGPLTNGMGPSIPDEDAMAIDLDQENNPDDDLKTWKLSSVVPDIRKSQYRRYALYALSKIFRSTIVSQDDGNAQSILRIQFFPPNVFQWLLHTGHLSVASIRHAMLEESPKNAHLSPSIVDGDIVKALVDFDPDLHILSAILNYSGHLPVGEVVQAIKLLMQSLDEQPKAQNTTKLLTNGNAPSEEEMDVDITSELDAATNEVDHALSVLDHGLLIRSHTLRPALLRLHGFSPRIITTTLRSMLARHDLEALISLLHLEMKNGGWSSSYDGSDADPSPLNESPDDHAVAIIASLLSCTLDAIGAGAWLATVGNSAESESSEDIIEALQSDTSEALNGFWEARYMRGLLGEFLRFASNLPKSHKPSSKSLERQGKPFAVTQDDGELPMLPLGAKPDMGIEKMKSGRGGKKDEISKREMGLLISKKVPKYSFEKIVV
ncbi:hypothetical protein HBH64_041650 [Parastagonospora nodorum]|nr:hypothetical protein HBH52_097430 [Parastagonospora nodorum]KAH3999704.1 hypothetical protein HBI10_116000 [Parastagonospora nodorum]KAH4013273.1 hypothetical protein HBI13_182050 [Parastagonospora nodorum]KAH4064097.1 hypothetical protein HBH50_182450 [Parastagonospora nodorum]KAH4087477.1 hypothetical protein HBH48_132760 [Parastagonospora nodorum]